MTGRLLALDWGEKRIGVAMSDESQTLAQPLTTLTRRIGKRFPMQQLKAILDLHHPVGIVVGLPLTGEGHEGGAALAARAMGDAIARKSGLPVTYMDERMTSARAHRAITEMGGGLKGRKDDVDQLAATVLLQQYLDTQR
ncbi:MAG: Holliday junction resolvase RuvX [Gemmatimonadales bacterium]